MNSSLQSLQTATPAPQGYIDFDELLDRCMGKLDLVERVLLRFQESAEREIESLQLAAKTSDTDQIGKIAHRIIGSSKTVAAHMLAECSERLEAHAAEESMEAVLQCVDEMVQTYRHVQNNLMSTIQNK